MRFLKSINIEFRKLKSTPALKLAILSGLFIPTIYFFYYVLKWESLTPNDDVNPWDKFISDQIRNSTPFLLPILVILQTSLEAQIEHKVNGFKYVFTQPVERFLIYLSKFFASLILLLISYVTFATSIYVVGKIAGLLHPELKLLETVFPFHKIMNFSIVTLIANIGILSIQFWLSMRFKNFIIPIGVGMVLLITGLIVYGGEEALYFPYSYSLYSLTEMNENWFPQAVGWYSIAFFVVFNIIGCIEITKKNIV